MPLKIMVSPVRCGVPIREDWMDASTAYRTWRLRSVEARYGEFSHRLGPPMDSIPPKNGPSGKPGKVPIVNQC